MYLYMYYFLQILSIYYFLIIPEVMHKILLIILLLTISFNLSAQLKDTSKPKPDRDLLSVRNVKRAGIALSATGFTLFSVGLIRFATSPTECDPTSPGGNQDCHFTEIHGEGFLLAGAITMAVGIPVWTFARQKERYGRIKILPWFSSAQVDGIGLEITF
jgi:hypothetical protein